MMNWLFCAMLLLSFVFALLNGKIPELSVAAITECGNAVKLLISLSGIMCMWSGLVNIAEKAGLTEKLSKLLSPLTKLLFKGVPKNSPAMNAITMNIMANMLGLGNAATPLGIKAMKELEKLEHTGHVASNNMVVLVVLNTAAIQLIPTTNALLRLNNGAKSPMDFIPAVWITSICSVCVGITFAKLFSGFKTKNEEVKFVSH